MEALTIERLLAFKETLAAIMELSNGPLRADAFPGAIGGVGYASDVWSLFCEAQRNANAFTQWHLGEEAFGRMLASDGA